MITQCYLVANVHYVFPQWFNPCKRQPIVRGDVRSPGIVRELWQVRLHAYLMLRAFDLTEDKALFDSAQRRVEMLMERVRFRVTNAVYDRAHVDPAEFPVTELSGNA